MSDLVIQLLLLIDGLVIGLAAIFAHEIGLDPNTDWGASRFVLLFIGLILVSFSFALMYFRNRRDNFFINGLKSETAKTLFSLVHIWLIIFLKYKTKRDAPQS